MLLFWTIDPILGLLEIFWTEVTEASYTVKLLNGKIIHRNRVDLRPTSVQFQPISAVPISLPAVTPNAGPSTVTKPSNTDSLTVSQPPKARSPSKSCTNTVVESQPRVGRPASNVKGAVVTTRSGCIVRPPLKLNL